MRLDEYRQRLQSRVIERYDAAVASGNLATMAQCARIMSEFQRGQETCVQVTRVGCSDAAFAALIVPSAQPLPPLLQHQLQRSCAAGSAW